MVRPGTGKQAPDELDAQAKKARSNQPGVDGYYIGNSKGQLAAILVHTSLASFDPRADALRRQIEALIAQRHALAPLKVIFGASFAGLLQPEHTDAFELVGIGGVGTSAVLTRAGVVDVLPVHLASLTNAPTSIRVEERLPSGAFRGLGFFEHFGFGRTPEQDAHVYQPGAMIAHMTTPLALVADGRGDARASRICELKVIIC